MVGPRGQCIVLGGVVQVCQWVCQWCKSWTTLPRMTTTPPASNACHLLPSVLQRTNTVTDLFTSLQPGSTWPELALGSGDSLRIQLTVSESGSPVVPAYAAVQFVDADGRDSEYAVGVKATGKASFVLVSTEDGAVQPGGCRERSRGCCCRSWRSLHRCSCCVVLKDLVAAAAQLACWRLAVASGVLHSSCAAYSVPHPHLNGP